MDDSKIVRFFFRRAPPSSIVIGKPFHFEVELADETAVPHVLSRTSDYPLRISILKKDSCRHETFDLIMTPDVPCLARKTSRVPVKARVELRSSVDGVNTTASSKPIRQIQIDIYLQNPLDHKNDSTSSCEQYQKLGLQAVRGPSSYAFVVPIFSDWMTIQSIEEQQKMSFVSLACERKLYWQGSVVTISEHYGESMGSHLWDSSIVLGAFLAKYSSFLAFNPKYILELGAGSGFIGILLAFVFTGSCIVETDRKGCLSLLNCNLKAHNVMAKIRELVWNNQEDIAKLKIEGPSSYDILVGADILYFWSKHYDLLNTILQLTSNSSRIILAQKRRNGATFQHIQALIDKKFTCLDKICRQARDQLACPWTFFEVHLVHSSCQVDILELRRKAKCTVG